MKELKGSLPPVPAIPELPVEKPSPSAPPPAPHKTGNLEPQPVSPKTGAQQPAVSPPQPVSPKRAAAAAPMTGNKAAIAAAAPSPRVKQVEPVKKNLPESAPVPLEDENRRMDKFIKSLD